MNVVNIFNNSPMWELRAMRCARARMTEHISLKFLNKTTGRALVISPGPCGLIKDILDFLHPAIHIFSSKSWTPPSLLSVLWCCWSEYCMTGSGLAGVWWRSWWMIPNHWLSDSGVWISSCYIITPLTPSRWTSNFVYYIRGREDRLFYFFFLWNPSMFSMVCGPHSFWQRDRKNHLTHFSIWCPPKTKSNFPQYFINQTCSMTLLPTQEIQMHFTCI